MSRDRPSVQDEFVAEAQEIIEAYSRDLLLLEDTHKNGRSDPELVNAIFRAVHTLKGIAGMFGFAELGETAHVLEDLLDHLRLGRVDLSPASLDALFEGAEVLQRLLRHGREEDAVRPDVDGFGAMVQGLLRTGSHHPVDFAAHGLDSGLLSVVTEYEEYRLRANIEQGVPLFRLNLTFALPTIDRDLEDLKARAKPMAEVITYLPSMEADDEEAIALEVLLASHAPIDELRDALAIVAGSRLEAIEPRPEGEGAASKAETSLPPPVVSVPPVLAEPSVWPGAKGPSRRPRESHGEGLSLRAVAKTVRVDIEKLDHLMNVVGELALVRSAVGRLMESLRALPEQRMVATELHRIHRQFERHLEDLQDGVLDVRMVPLGQTFDRLARAVRQVAREHRKEVRLVVSGAETEVDKLIVEELADPLLHIIRNAIDHGIETEAARNQAGKPSFGTLALHAYQKGNHVVIEVEDDGRGMDDERIVQSAVARGVLAEDSASELGRGERLALIFAPGVSTASAVTELSGRGVGMDIVKTHIARLGGVVDIKSDVNVGTKFTITLPITLAIISALIVRVSGRTFALPLTVVQEALVFDPTAIRQVEGQEVMTLRGRTLPLCRLAERFEFEGVRPKKEFVVVTSLSQRRLGLVVDALEGQQDIIIKPLGASLADVRGVAGATDLGDQRVALVLDAPALLEEVLSSSDRARPGPARFTA